MEHKEWRDHVGLTFYSSCYSPHLNSEQSSKGLDLNITEILLLYAEELMEIA